MLPLEKRILGLKDVLTEAEQIQSPEGENLVHSIKKLIRRDEIELILQDYFINGHSFGYLLLQSQILEEQLRDVIRGAESTLSKEGKKPSLRSAASIGKLPFGELITKAKSYIEYTQLFDSLDKFNRDRVLIVHHLIDDYSVNIAALKQEIIQKYPPRMVANISIRLSEVMRRITERMLLTTLKNTPDSTKDFVKKLSSRLASEINLASENIQLLF